MNHDLKIYVTVSVMQRSSIFSREMTVVSRRALFKMATSPKLSPRLRNMIVLGTPLSIADTIAEIVHT